VGQVGFKGNYSGLENSINSNVDIYFLWDDKQVEFGKLYIKIGKKNGRD
jgi:hypothetical protein